MSFRDFAILNDIHVQHATGAGLTRLQDTIRDIARVHPLFVMVNGDLFDLAAADITAAVADQVRRTFRMLPCPVFFSLGNHDIGGVASLTDASPTNVGAFFDLVEDAFTQNADENSSTAEDVGYYHFYREGVHFIVLNSVELHGVTEGDYDLRTAQTDWLTATLAAITGSSSRVLVFSHIDPSQTSVDWARMKTTASAAVRTALQNWRTSTGGKVLAVISGHEHGLNNSSQERLTRTGSIDYLNLLDGLNAGASNIKPNAYSGGGKLAWSLVSWDETAGKLYIAGQNGASKRTLTPA